MSESRAASDARAWDRPPDSVTLWCRGWAQIALAAMQANVEFWAWLEERLKS